MTRVNALAPPLLIVRVAGLPAEAIDPFSHPELVDKLAESERLRKKLDEMRAMLVDCLHGAVRTAAREERRFLLSVKRSCFNAGSLRAFQLDPQWPLVVGIANALVEEIVTLERAVEEAEARLERLYESAFLREQESILRLLEHRDFVRGVSLASPDVAQNLGRLNGRDPDHFGRREKRLCLTLLRYASRAALKLSPFSTLTRTGLALAAGEAPGDFRLLPGSTWQERSTLSLRRELLEQCSSLLLRCRSFTEGLPVSLNESLAWDGDGRCTFFRPGRWEFDHESNSFRYSDASLVKARLEGPLVPWLVAQLSGTSWIYRHLLDQIRASLVDGEDLTQSIDELLEIGFLDLTLPWSFGEPELEHKILDQLKDFPAGTGPGDFRDRLLELAGVLASSAETASPPQLLRDAKQGVEALFRSLATPAGIPSSIHFKAYDRTFEEDVFLRPSPGAGGEHAIAHLSIDTANGLLRDLDPLTRLLSLHSRTHDLLYTLEAFAERHWPGRREVGLLELFAAAQPLFKEYLRYRAVLPLRYAPPPPEFNPLDLESVRRLNAWRGAIASRLKDCLQGSSETPMLCPRSLESLLDQVLAGQMQTCPYCAFVQPLDSGGHLWVLNFLGEGFGRLGSRYTSGMDGETRSYWADAFIPRSVFELDGEQVELVDMACPGHRTLNVHMLQTHRVLKTPGEHPAATPDRLIRLADLRVRLGGPEHPPALTDKTGRRLLPIPFGSLAPGGRPTLLKFLALFGPRELQWPLPKKAPRVRNEVRTLDRHLLGRIVYSRKKWMPDLQVLLAMLKGVDERGAYTAINRWRRENEIPNVVFVKEPISSTRSADREKPQYIDFSSPLFVQIFRSILKSGMKTLTLEEALPNPCQFPAHGSRWAVEVQLENFPFWRVSLPSRTEREDFNDACLSGFTRKE